MIVMLVFAGWWRLTLILRLAHGRHRVSDLLLSKCPMAFSDDVIAAAESRHSVSTAMYLICVALVSDGWIDVDLCTRGNSRLSQAKPCPKGK
jgi:hypothetical protein